MPGRLMVLFYFIFCSSYFQFLFVFKDVELGYVFFSEPQGEMNKQASCRYMWPAVYIVTFIVLLYLVHTDQIYSSPQTHKHVCLDQVAALPSFCILSSDS